MPKCSLNAPEKQTSVVDAADSDNEKAVKALVSALKGSDKVFIHTSGSSIVADQANGESADKVYGRVNAVHAATGQTSTSRHR